MYTYDATLELNRSPVKTEKGIVDKQIEPLFYIYGLTEVYTYDVSTASS